MRPKRKFIYRYNSIAQYAVHIIRADRSLL